MGACCGLEAKDDPVRGTALSATKEKEDLIDDKKVETVDPWKYAESLTVDEVTRMLKSMTFDECKPFIAPIKWAKVLKVYDGDTVHIGLSRAFIQSLTHSLYIFVRFNQSNESLNGMNECFE